MIYPWSGGEGGDVARKRMRNMRMNAAAEEGIDLECILANERVLTHFQPIVSFKTQATIGYEALCRGYHVESDELIPPMLLFGAACREERLIELDQLCRKKALRGYREIHAQNPDLLLFINVDVSPITDSNFEDQFLLNQICSSGIASSSVVIEIVESKVKDGSLLLKLVQFYRYYGFLIALDDVGSGHSNLDRIASIRPDIIKTDRSLIQEIDTNYYKQEVFKSLVGLSRNIGSLMLAEGVETEEEAIRSLQLGANLMQGFYFARPRADAWGTSHQLEQRLTTLAARFKQQESERFRNMRKKNDMYKKAAQIMIRDLTSVSSGDFHACLQNAILSFPFIEALYIIDRDGIQLTDTILNAHRLSRRGSLFKPAAKGDNHSLKDYHYFLMSTGSETFTTEPYISLATGSLCRTMAIPFEHLNRSRFILCSDIVE